MSKTSCNIAGLLTAAALSITSGAAFAAGAHGGGHGQAPAAAIGEPAAASAASRTVHVLMGDNFFEPESIRVGAGETVHFVLKNTGELLHEFNIGTAAMHADHQEEMMAMMDSGMLTATGMKTEGSGHSSHGMDHDDPNSVLVEPGQTKELTWRFPAATNLQFACNVPGHYQSGMVGDIKLDH